MSVLNGILSLPQAVQAGPTTRPTSSPASQPSSADADYLKLPLQRYSALHDVIRITRDGDRLAASSAADRLDEKTRLDVPGVPGMITIQPMQGLRQAPGAGVEPEPRFFIFEHRDMPSPGVDSIVMVTSGAGRLTLAQDVGPEDSVLSVQLLQAPPDAEPNPNEPTVRLYIARGTQKILTAGAITFTQLCNEHPREIDEYVRPMLRDLGSEAAVFAPDPRGAWQVLADSYQPDAATRAKVDAALSRLDVADFQTREAAAGELQEIGQPAALMLMNADRSKMSPEKQSNIDTFLAPYQPYSLQDVKRLRDDLSYLLDCLSLDDATLRTLAWKRLKDVAKPTIDFNPSASESVRFEAIAKLRDSMKR